MHQAFYYSFVQQTFAEFLSHAGLSQGFRLWSCKTPACPWVFAIFGVNGALKKQMKEGMMNICSDKDDSRDENKVLWEEGRGVEGRGERGGG